MNEKAQNTGNALYAEVVDSDHLSSVSLPKDSDLTVTPELKATLYLNTLMRQAKNFDLPSFQMDSDIDNLTGRIHQKDYRQIKDSSLPQRVKMAFLPQNNGDRLKQAGAYYLELIKPLLSTGRDSFVPTPEYIDTLCSMLASQEGANIVLYYALSKTKSPKRTGSPDTIIDMAEIEMLRHYALMTRTAAEAGLHLHFTLVDESDVLPDNDPLGLDPVEKEINRMIAEQAIRHFDSSKYITIRSLKESVVDVLGGDFEAMFAQRYKQNWEAAYQQVVANEDTALRIRAFTFLDIMPDASLLRFGIESEEEIQRVRQLAKTDDLTTLPENLFHYLILQTAQFAAIMDLRSDAQKKVLAEEDIRKYPEYNPHNRVYAGITNAPNRLSLKPHPKPSLGKKINPMHGLVLYNGENGTYIGIAEYAQLKRDVHDSNLGEIVYANNNKPIFAVRNIFGGRREDNI
ncbi:MAG TPA: hypothetical protein VGT05_03820 [Patescibacteria group bacterium]|nr:hypothetical protein [Patescibacteria group bacterium]